MESKCHETSRRVCTGQKEHNGTWLRLGVVGVLGTGVPRLACLRPAVWLKWGLSMAHPRQHKAQDPREGPSLARRTTWRFLKHGVLRLARQEAERSRRVPHEVPMTQA